MSEPTTGYKTVLLKVSGESLGLPGSGGLDTDAIHTLAREIMTAAQTGARIGVVVGGGNIIRGATLAEAGLIPQASADYMGMLGTIINGIALKESLESLGQPARLMSAIIVHAVAEPFIRGRAMRHLDKGRVIILAAGTGNPFCTTDTAAALRAAELNCDVILKATKVDGIYDSDPQQNPDAKRFDQISYAEAMQRQLKIMDLTAFSMCMEHDIPIVVFDFKVNGNVRAVVEGKRIGTLVNSTS